MAKASRKTSNGENIQRFGPGTDPQGNPYDELYIIGKTRLYIIKPRITREENERRLKEVGRVIGNILGCEATVTYRKSPVRAHGQDILT